MENNNIHIPKFLRSQTFIAFSILVLAGGAAWYILAGFPSFMPEFSKAVAVVNGEKISKKSFDESLAQAPSEFGESQVLDFMINTVLLRQDAEKRGIEIKEQEVDLQLSQITAQFSSEAEFEKVLKQEGISRSEFRKEISDQLLLEKYTELIVQERGIEASEEEIMDFYQELAAQENMPELSEIKNEIESYIISQKLQIELQEILAELRQRAQIEILI